MSRRLVDLRSRFDGWILLTDPSDVRWVSGFSGSNGWVLVGPDTATLLTDARYTERAMTETAGRDVEVVVCVDRSSTIATIRARAAENPVACRPSAITHETWTNLESAGVRLVPHDSSESRRSKDSDAIDTIRRAADIASRALMDVLPFVVPGVTEREIRIQLDDRMRDLGADRPSYDTIVAAGPDNSAVPHHSPADYRLDNGDLVVIDVGAEVDGFHSDMTRTFVVGDPSDLVREWYEALAGAQREGVEAVRAGVSAREIDAVCRRALGDLADFFVHGTGHGVGLDIHEEPFLNRSSNSFLVEGDVVTIEPGLYRKGTGGMRIEDLLVVRNDSSENLTLVPKDLTCLPSRPTI